LEREQAASAAQRPDEDVIESRAAESDKGFPAPFNQHLTAEEQADIYMYVLDKRRQQALEEEQEAVPVPCETEVSVYADDAASSERASNSDETGSDRASFVTAVEGPASSRADRKKLRTRRYLQARSESGFVMLPAPQHKMRQQNAVMLGVPVDSLERLTGPQIEQMNCTLISMQVGELADGEPLQTSLMASVQMTPATRDGTEGTLVKVKVAAESKVFLPTRNKKELSQRRVQIVGDLADHTLQALNEVGRKNSAQQRLMRTMLNEQMKGLEMQKIPGVRDLVMTEYDGDPAERVLRASMALGQAIREGETKLEDLPEPPTAELEDIYVPVQEYLAAFALEVPSGEGSDGEARGPSPSPPLPTAWPLVREEDVEEGRCPPPPPPLPSA
jgi:hypothetical protein